MQLGTNVIVDGFGPFPEGMNSGLPPQLLKREQLAMATNTSLRGYLPTPRPPYQKLTVSGDFDGTGIFQGACYYKPDAGTESIVAAIGGRLFTFTPSATTAISAYVDGGDAFPNYLDKNWLWQSEKWVIRQDGQSTPQFFDGTSCRRARSRATLGTMDAIGTYSVPALGATALFGLTANYTGDLYERVSLYSPTSVWMGYFEVRPTSTAEPQISLTLAGTGTGPVAAGTTIQQASAWITKVTSNATVAGSVWSTPLSFAPTVGQLLYPVSGGSATFWVVQSSLGGGLYGLVGATQPLAGWILSTATSITWATVGITTAIIASIPSTAITVNIDRAFTGADGTQVMLNGICFSASKVNQAAGTSIALLNINGTPSASIASGSTIVRLDETPIGKMGAYIRGRNWMALADGKHWVASDILGGSSGSTAYQYRDAPLKMTETQILGEGGAFGVPSGSGEITFITGLSALDASLGQGAIQIGTPYAVFSCNPPEDRMMWQSLTSPFLAPAMIGRGGLGQDGAAAVNGDLFMRSHDGIRSLIMARREFWTWGNTPQSFEVRDILAADDASMLRFCSIVEFDNRLLISTGLTRGAQGVYGTKLAVLNFDPVSSLRGKQAAIYDGVWENINPLALVKGIFSGQERCFAFTQNTTTSKIELWEILPASTTATQDHGTTDISLGAESPVLFDTVEGKKRHNDLCRLVDGELYVKGLSGNVTFSVYFRPDYDTAWHLWRTWTIDSTPTYQPRMGLGDPPTTCDADTGRPWAEGHSFQFKLVIAGKFTLVGMRAAAAVMPTDTFASLPE